jgi:hypothetical protein
VAFKTSVPPLSKDALAKALSQQTIPSRQEMGSLSMFLRITASFLEIDSGDTSELHHNFGSSQYRKATGLV